MDISVSGGNTLLGMINDLLDVEKLESGAMHLDCVLLSVDELIGAAIGQVASLAEGQADRAGSKRKTPPAVPACEGDEKELLRTLVNLLGNAIKFTPQGGTVTAGASYVKGAPSILFSVSDTGEGIPVESFGRIFEKFGQVSERKAGRTMSTGLGLTFCKLAVESHGGQIGVESTPGIGSNFWFTIPLMVPGIDRAA